jgi:hypothetical protein
LQIYYQHTSSVVTTKAFNHVNKLFEITH